MVHIICLVYLFILCMAATKIPLEEWALVVGTRQNLSNLLFFDIYVNN
jgi:hypothetical protein